MRASLTPAKQQYIHQTPINLRACSRWPVLAEHIFQCPPQLQLLALSQHQQRASLHRQRGESVRNLRWLTAHSNATQKNRLRHSGHCLTASFSVVKTERSLIARLKNIGPAVDSCLAAAPTCVFRCGSTGAYHGQALMRRSEDEQWYERLVNNDV